MKTSVSSRWWWRAAAAGWLVLGLGPAGTLLGQTVDDLTGAAPPVMTIAPPPIVPPVAPPEFPIVPPIAPTVDLVVVPTAPPVMTKTVAEIEAEAEAEAAAEAESVAEVQSVAEGKAVAKAKAVANAKAAPEATTAEPVEMVDEEEPRAAQLISYRSFADLIEGAVGNGASNEYCKETSQEQSIASLVQAGGWVEMLPHEGVISEAVMSPGRGRTLTFAVGALALLPVFFGYRRVGMAPWQSALLRCAGWVRRGVGVGRMWLDRLAARSSSFRAARLGRRSESQTGAAPSRPRHATHIWVARTLAASGAAPEEIARETGLAREAVQLLSLVQRRQILAAENAAIGTFFPPTGPTVGGAGGAAGAVR